MTEYLETYLENKEDEMTTQITKKEETSLTQLSETSWGSEGASNEDLLVPRILLMQAMSKFVSDGKAAPGDIIESVSMEVLAKVGHGVDVIPFKTFKEWRKYKTEKGETEYLGKELWGPHNSHYQYDEVKGDVTYRNDLVLNYFVLLANRSNELPCLVSFSKSSYYAGKKLSSHFLVCREKKLPPANTVFTLSSQRTTSDKYTFFTLDISKKRESKKEELAAARRWWETLSNSAAKVDENTSEEVPF